MASVGVTAAYVALGVTSLFLSLSPPCANGFMWLDVRPFVGSMVRSRVCEARCQSEMRLRLVAIQAIDADGYARSVGRHLRTEVFVWPRGTCSLIITFTWTAVGCKLPRTYRTV